MNTFCAVCKNNTCDNNVMCADCGKIYCIDCSMNALCSSAPPNSKLACLKLFHIEEYKQCCCGKYCDVYDSSECCICGTEVCPRCQYELSNIYCINCINKCQICDQDSQYYKHDPICRICEKVVCVDCTSEYTNTDILNDVSEETICMDCDF